MSKTGRLLFQIVLFASFGTIMFVSDLIMEALPNIHLIAMFTVCFTVVYRAKALVPIYIYVFLTLFTYGFPLWAIPYLYIWTVLWGITMLLPRNMPTYIAVPVYMLICGLHGICFGLMYAPAQILMFFGGDWGKFFPWVLAGLPFDLTHAIGNICTATLIVPITKVLSKTPGAVKLKQK